MSRINVDFTAVADADGRFARLASLLGLADADHARGKCEHLWVACTTLGSPELPLWRVEQVLGPHGAGALIDAQLARWARGRGDSSTRLVRISGAERRCLWRASMVDQSSNGGKARAQTASRSAGRFTSRDDDQTAGASTSPPAPAPAPAQRSDLSGTPDLALFEPEATCPKPDRAVEIADLAISEINRLARRAFDPRASANLKLASGLARQRRTDDEILLVIRSKRAWIGDPTMGQYFRPATLLGPEKFATYLDEAKAHRAPPRVVVVDARDDEPDLSYTGMKS